MKGRVRGPRGRRRKRRKLLSCSWHRLAWLVGLEMTAHPPSFHSLLSYYPCFFHSDSHLRLPSHPFLCFLSFRPGSLCSQRFVSCQLLHFPPLQYPRPPISTSLPCSLITPPLPTHLSFCDAEVDKKTGARSHQHFEKILISVFLKLPGKICFYETSQIKLYMSVQGLKQVSYRSRPWDRDGAGVASPPLGCLPVLFVGSFKHFLHFTDWVLAHCRDIHVTPETL